MTLGRGNWLPQRAGTAGIFVTTTRKVAYPLTIDEAADRIREFATWKVFTPTTNDILAAIALHEQAQLSFWDAMVVQAAAELGCGVLWTEDMNHGQVLRGVNIRNPFIAQEERTSRSLERG